VNSILSVVLGLSVLVWLGGFAFVSPGAQAQTTADTIAALQQQIAALQAQLAALSGSATTGSTTGGMITKTLYQGLRDPQVSVLQQWLATMPSIYPSGLVTGYFGSLTKAAVMAYQASKGIAQVGQVGPQTRAALNAQFGGTSTGTGTGTSTGTGTTPPPVAGSQVGVSLAPTTPASGVAPLGATGIKMLSVNFTAPASGPVTITDLIVHRVGVGNSSDFNNVYLYDGTSRLVSGRSVNSASNNAEFHNLSIVVAAGTTKTIDVVADIYTAATPGDVNSFQLVSASSVGSNAAVVGTFPINGNNFSIAGASEGTVTITNQGSALNSAPKVGDLQADVAKFSLQASSAEDLTVRRITIYNGGSINQSNLANFNLYAGGSVIATAPTMDSKGYLTFVLANPYVITRGNTITFDVYGDILAGSRSGDTIIFYLDQAADLYVTGNTYGFGAAVTNSYSSGTTLTVAGGQVTITFNGPITQNWSKGTTGVVLLNFNIATKNNTEFREINLTLTPTTTVFGDGTTAYITNVRILDTTTGLVVVGPKDAENTATATAQTLSFTDRFDLPAGANHNYEVLCDISSSITAGSLKATLLASSFNSGYVKNTDNNTNITDIVPTTDIAGNNQTIVGRSLALSLAGTPVSQTYVRGSSAKDMGGFNFTAGLGGDAIISNVVVTSYDGASSGSFAVATNPANRVLDLKLIDQATGNQIGTVQSVNSTNGESTFSNLQYTVPAGTTKTILVRADLTNNALLATTEVYKVDIVGSSDVTANDVNGNSVSFSGYNPNSGNSVYMSIGSGGTISVVKAPDDIESQQQIVLAGQSNVPLAKFRVTASNEDLKVVKSEFDMTSGAVNNVYGLTLWDGSTQIAGPLTVGSNGVTDFNSMSFLVPMNTSKTLTVKGNLNTIAGGATSGDTIQIVYATSSNFEADGTSPGSSTQVTSFSGATAVEGNSMVVRKTKPTFALLYAGGSQGAIKLTPSAMEIARFNVSADAAEQVAIKHLAFTISLTNATLTANTLSLYDLDNGQPITSTNTVAASGSTGLLTLTTESTIPAGGTKHYALKATVSSISTSGGSGSASVQTSLLNSDDSTDILATTSSSYTASLLVRDTLTGATSTPDVVWSDYSVVGHTEGTSADYANGHLLKDFSNTVSVTN